MPVRPQVAARPFEKSGICRELKRLEESRPESRLTTGGGAMGAREVLRHHPIMCQSPLARSERPQGARGLAKISNRPTDEFPLALLGWQVADVL